MWTCEPYPVGVFDIEVFIPQEHETEDTYERKETENDTREVTDMEKKTDVAASKYPPWKNDWWEKILRS